MWQRLRAGKSLAAWEDPNDISFESDPEVGSLLDVLQQDSDEDPWAELDDLMGHAPPVVVVEQPPVPDAPDAWEEVSLESLGE